MSKLSKKRPWVTLSTAISLDGKIATLKGGSQLSNKEDWIRVHNLRAQSDAIMVGSGTIRMDDSKLTVKEELIGRKIEKNPIRIVVSSKGNLPLESRVFQVTPKTTTILATTSNCPNNVRNALEKAGNIVLICGDEPSINLSLLMETLYRNYHIRNLMLEGGSRLNGFMLEEKLIDEVHLAIAPVVCGEGFPLFTLQNSFSQFAESPIFVVRETKTIGDMVLLKIVLEYRKREI